MYICIYYVYNLLVNSSTGWGPRVKLVSSSRLCMIRPDVCRRWQQQPWVTLLRVTLIRLGLGVVGVLGKRGGMVINPWKEIYMGMDQYLLIQFLVGWTSIYQLFWCSPGVQGFDTLPYSNCKTISPMFWPWQIFVRLRAHPHRAITILMG